MDDTDTTTATEIAQADGWDWAIVEVFGHRQIAGRIREEERFGAKMLRIDMPVEGDPAAKGWTTQWYGGASIFSLTLADEASVLAANRPYAAPFRARLPPASAEIEDADVFDEDDGGAF